MPVNNPPSLRLCGMSNAPRVIYRPREDATAEGELDALAAVYAHLLKNRKNVEPAPEPDVHDPRGESKHDSRARISIYE